MAQISDEGIEVTLVVATRGEEGEISSLVDAGQSELGQIRENELRCAVEELGVDNLYIFEYRDSGMDGSPSNNHPKAFVNAPEDELVEMLVGLIRQHKPEVLMTFEPNGGYGHPDHIAVHRHASRAFLEAGDPDAYPDQGRAWRPGRLFYTAIPRSFFDEMRKLMVSAGIDTSELDWLDSNQNQWTLDQVDLVVDVSGSVERKWAALECHRTQFGPEHLFRKLPEGVSQQLLSKEFFALAWPEEPPEGGLTSLFEAL